MGGNPRETIQSRDLLELDDGCVVCAYCGSPMSHRVEGGYHKWTCETPLKPEAGKGEEWCMVEYQFAGAVGDEGAVGKEFECLGRE